MKSFFLSVVIPSYNEMANLQKGVLDKVQHYLEKNKFKYEVIIVDDGSDDGSLEFVERFVKENKKFQLIKNEHLGKAGSVTKGVLAGAGDYILFADMDQATPIEEFDKFIPYAFQDYDVVIGSRKARQGAPLSRRVMSKSAIILRSVIIGLKDIKDTQCGFKLFKKSVAKDIFSEIKRVHLGFKSIHGSSVTAGFDMEILYIATKRGYKIKEVPVNWLYVESRRVSPIRDSLEGVLDILKIKRNIIKRIYK